MAKKKTNTPIKPAKKLISDYDIAYDFATKVYQKFDKIIKSIALFGSVSKGTAVSTPNEKSDIDIIIIIDDCAVQWDEELIAWYRAELAKIIDNNKYSKDIHISSVTMTSFWHDIKTGEPVSINILRSGQPLIDFGGFFNPLKVLLARGFIKPSPEAVYTTLKRAPIHLARSRYNVLSAIEGLYWGMVDAAHAALMAAHETPPSPEHIPEMLRNNDRIRIKEKYIKDYEDIYHLAHSVTQGNITAIAGSKIEEYDQKANLFVQKMIDITKELLGDEKIIDIKPK